MAIQRDLSSTEKIDVELEVLKQELAEATILLENITIDDQNSSSYDKESKEYMELHASLQAKIADIKVKINKKNEDNQLAGIKEFIETFDENEKFKILIVDDTSLNRMIMRRSLTDKLCRGVDSKRYIIEEATDGDDAVRMAKATQYHLMIFDVLMPRMKGPVAIRLIRDHEKSLAANSNFHPATIFVCSATPEVINAEFDKANLKREEVDGFLDKAFKQEQITKSDSFTILMNSRKQAVIDYKVKHSVLKPGQRGGSLSQEEIQAALRAKAERERVKGIVRSKSTVVQTADENSSPLDEDTKAPEAKTPKTSPGASPKVSMLSFLKAKSNPQEANAGIDDLDAQVTPGDADSEENVQGLSKSPQLS